MTGLSWNIAPELWRDRTVVVLATGETLTETVVDAVRAAHAAARCAVVAVNDAYRLAPWADMLYAADGLWWEFHWQRGAGEFRGLRVTAQRQVRYPVTIAEVSGHRGFDPRPGYIRTGGNSGYQALHVAAQLGARKIVLCGLDMQGSHFFGPHPKPLNNTGSYAHHILQFETLAKPLADLGVDVVNVSPRSALRAFRRGELAAELA